MGTPPKDLAEEIAAGNLPLEIGRVFAMHEIVAAHRCMEASEANSKIVVLAD